VTTSSRREGVVTKQDWVHRSCKLLKLLTLVSLFFAQNPQSK
jgi:hypothetical protein